MNDYGVKMEIRSSEVKGEVNASPSKSQTHRALICAALAGGVSTIYGPLLCDDTEATLQACKSLGAEILSKGEEKIVIRGNGGIFNIKECSIDCRESGSTLRFLAPVAAISGAVISFSGRTGLERRPVNELLSVLEEMGASVEYPKGAGSLPFTIISKGKPSGRHIKISGNVSSQFTSGLLFALPLMEGESSITITTDLESMGYVELTIDVLERFGISISRTPDLRKITVHGGQAYRASEIMIEGDYSSSSYLLVAGALAGGEGGVTVRNLRRESKQGDRRIVQLLESMGASLEQGDSYVTVRRSDLKGSVMEVSNTPDLVPALAVASAFSKGVAVLKGTGRLRLKESDRVNSIVRMIEMLDGKINVDENSLAIQGGVESAASVSFDSTDHRMVMSAVVAGLARNGRTMIESPVSIKKSYPDFFDHIRSLGGDVTTVSNSIGKVLKVSVYGESHGRRIGAVLEGVPEGIKVEREYIQKELDKRRSTSLLTTTRMEPDIVEVLSGIEDGITNGGDVRMEIKNRDVRSEAYVKGKGLIRPGHADYTARMKYGSVFDYRGGGFLSGRMTAAFVAAGSVAKSIIGTKGIKVIAHIVQIGTVKIGGYPKDEEIESLKTEGVIRCVYEDKAMEMMRAVEEARMHGDSIGGVVECRIIGLPVGVGEPIFHSFESEISGAMFAIPAVKGVEFGSGFSGAGMRGSENNDPFTLKQGIVTTLTNNSGGILGGISNGMTVVFRVAFKPTSSISRAQQTVDYSRGEVATISVKGRHDPCIAVRAPPVVEAMAALTVADLMMISGDI